MALVLKELLVSWEMATQTSNYEALDKSYTKTQCGSALNQALYPQNLTSLLQLAEVDATVFSTHKKSVLNSVTDQNVNVPVFVFRVVIEVALFKHADDLSPIMQALTETHGPEV